jgi:protein ImuB
VRRVACLALPEIRLEIAQERARPGSHRPRSGRQLDHQPLAIVIARPGGSIKTERDVLGGTRLDVVSRPARALGVRPKQTVAAARAKCAELRVRVIAEEAVRSALERVAEAAQSFGPAVAFDVAQDVVWVEIGGCAHLHGGEDGLARAIHAKVESLGHACRVSIADGPRVAAAVARFAPSRRGGPLVVPQGKGAAAMRVLPIAALSLDPDDAAWLADLGMRSCGDLQKLPRRSLGIRLGARVHDVIPFLFGEDPAPIVAWRPPEVPEERLELEWGAASIEALAFVMKTLCDRLAARLDGRAMAAARLELVLGLDRALCDEETRARASSPSVRLGVALPSPIARAADLLAVMRTRLERETLEAPVLTATLRAPELARLTARTLDLLVPEPKAQEALPRLVAELAAELGGERVGTLGLVDTWSPSKRTRLRPFGEALLGERPDEPLSPTTSHPAHPSKDPGYRYSLVASAVEPTRVIRPLRLSHVRVEEVEHLMRVEAIEWWRVRREEAANETVCDHDDPAPTCPSDWVAAWTSDPIRSEGRHVDPRAAHALAWVEVASSDRGKASDRLDDARLRGWID